MEEYWIKKVTKRRDVKTDETSHTSSFFVYVDETASNATGNPYTSIDILNSRDSRLPQLGDLIGKESTSDYSAAPLDGGSDYAFRVSDRNISQLDSETLVYEMTVTCGASNGGNNPTNGGYFDGRIVSLDFDIMQYQVEPIIGLYLGDLYLKTIGDYEETFDNNGHFKQIADSAGQRFLTDTPKCLRCNLIMNLTYDTTRLYTSDILSELALVCGSMNQADTKVAGMSIKAGQGRINKAKPIINRDKKVRVAYEIEIAVGMPHYAMVLDAGVKQKLSSGKIESITEKDIYPENGSTLPITEPVPLNGDGGILHKATDTQPYTYAGVFLKYVPIAWFRDTVVKNANGTKTSVKMNSALINWNTFIGKPFEATQV